MKTAPLIATLIGLASSLAQAEESSIGIYAVPGIFMDDQGAAKTNASKVHPSFRQALNVPAAVGQLQQAVKQAFPQVRATIDSKNRLRTLALSVQVTRATRYEIAKPDGTSDIYLPITMSAYLSNPMTGEVLQSFSKTNYKIFSIPRTAVAPEDEVKVAQYYREVFNDLLADLIGTVGKEFHPFIAKATITDDWKGMAVLNAGNQDGIAKGDLLEDEQGNELRIEHAGAHYAVAQTVLGKFAKGATFSRPVMMKVSDVKKPKVLTFVSEGNQDFSDAVVTQLFSDRLGDKAPFANLPLNPNFSQVQATIDRETTIGHAVSGQRSLPEYFIRLSLPNPDSYEIPTNVSYKTTRNYRGWGFAELIAKDGRVVFATDVAQSIEDTVSMGVGFAAADRREVVLKNTLNELAIQFANKVAFTPVQRSVIKTDTGQIILDDADNQLADGESVRVFHPLGSKASNGDPILSPIWEARIDHHEGSQAVARLILPIGNQLPAPTVGDVVITEKLGTTTPGNKIAFCPANKAQVGSVAINDFQLLAEAGAAASKGNLANPALPKWVNGLVGGQTGFRSDLSLPAVQTTHCLEALYRIDPKDKACKDEVCNQPFNVRVAYRLKQGEQNLKQSVLEHTFVSRSFPASASDEQLSALYRSELRADTRNLLDDVMKALTSKP